MSDTRQSFASMPSVDDFEEKRVLAELQESMFGTAEPVQLGRYSIGRRLGSGAMGVVYEAQDPRLRRRVALKVLHPDLRAVHASRGHQRLRREAQSLSQVSHPNVIDVYDVGESNGRVYLAMELVDGVSLDAWLSQEPRSAAEILNVFAQAGQGLAAAHESGVIHRDFKPSNASIDRDGRVRVLDFGLAKVESGGPSTSEGDADESPSSQVTRDGALVGTPRYMAPELLLGQSATERSDQYAFCVALYEALLGRPPFDETEMVASKIAANRVSMPSMEGVSGRVQRALECGLSPDPARRFGSMHALLAHLDSRSRGSLRWALAGVLLVGAGVAAVLPASESQVAQLVGVAEPVPASSPAWDEDLARASGVLANDDVGAAEQIARRVLARARDAQDRVTSSRASIVLGKLLHRQGRNEEALDALEQAHLDAVVARAHDERAEAAAQIASILLKSGRTAAADRWLRDSTATIEGTDVRPGTELTGLLARVENARQTGQRELGAELAAEALGLARDVGDPREENVAFIRAAMLFELQRFEEAAAIVTELLARADAEGKETATTAECLMLLAGAEASMVRAGDKSAVDSSFVHARRGVALYASLPGIKPMVRVRAELNLANVLGSGGKRLEAVKTLQGTVARVRASETLMAQAGVVLADLESSLGFELVQLEEYSTAEEHLHRSTLIFEELHGLTHPHLYAALVMLARAQRRQGKHAAATLTIEKLLSMPGLTDHEQTSTLWEAAEVSAAAGRAEEAAERFEASAKVFERVGDPEGAAMVRLRAAEVREG